MPTEVYYKNRERLHRSLTESPARRVSLWENVSVLPFQQDPAARILFREDFNEQTIASNTFGGWTFTNATSGTVANDTTNPNGVITISAGAATANQGVNFQLNAVPYKLHATRPLLFEARVQFTGLTNLRVQALIGLFATSTALIASGALANVSGIGFGGVTTTGVLVARTYSGSATSGTGLTLVNSTWYRLGFVATTSTVDFYVNGAKVSSITATIPTVALAPSFVCQANGTDTSVLNVDYVAISAPRA